MNIREYIDKHKEEATEETEEQKLTKQYDRLSKELKRTENKAVTSRVFYLLKSLNDYSTTKETRDYINKAIDSCIEKVVKEEIKMIDLLEMIANDSKLPSKVIYGDTTYLLDADSKEYYEEGNENNLLFDFDGTYKLDEQLKEVLRVEREVDLWEQ